MDSVTYVMSKDTTLLTPNANECFHFDHHIALHDHSNTENPDQYRPMGYPPDLHFSCVSVLRIFGGLVWDIKRKLPFYWSDLRDALSLQCLASVLFLYCACMSPVITFGGLLGEATKGNIVSVQFLICVCVCVGAQNKHLPPADGR